MKKLSTPDLKLKLQKLLASTTSFDAKKAEKLSRELLDRE